MYKKEKLSLSSINFCTMSNDELMKIFDFCEVMDIVNSTEMIQKKIGEECVEKRWDFYDVLVVTPNEIKVSTSPYPSKIIMTAEKYFKIKNF